MSSPKTVHFSRAPIAIRIVGSEGPSVAIPPSTTDGVKPLKRRTIDPKVAEEAAAAKAAADAAIENAYKRGYESAYRELQEEREALKTRVLCLEEQTFRRLEIGHEDLIAQIGFALPKLVTVGVKRLITNLEIPADTIAAMIDELLVEVHPGSGALEVIVSEHDLVALEANHDTKDGLKQKYPGINFKTDPKLERGDCLLKSRFGTIDGRISTKMENLEDLLQ